MNAVTSGWEAWIQTNWASLKARAKVTAPSYLPHPRFAGFQLEGVAAPSGQTADWVIGMQDGSRIHVQEFAEGRLVVHRDQYDPNRGVGHMLAHLVFDTPLVPVLCVGLFLFAVAESARAA